MNAVIKGLVPGIVGVGYNGGAGAVQDGNDIALQVGGVVVGGAVPCDG